MAIVISIADIPPEYAALVTPELLQIMVDGANARASRVAPCLAAPTLEQLSEAKLVLIGSVTRWTQAGSGAVVQHSAGAFSETMDTRQRSGYNLWPSEITQLQEICGADDRTAFSIDTAPTEVGSDAPDWWGYETGNWAGPDLGTATPGV